MIETDFRSFTRSENDFHEFSLMIDHLGLIAGMCDELDIIAIIDQQLGNTHHNMKISSGQAVMAIILNLLNVLQHPLMLAPEFMENRPIDRLITPSSQQAIMREHEITSEHFNQYVLGRTLDRLYEHGLEDLFMTIAGRAYQQFHRYTSRFLHTDTTSKSVYGNYENGSDRSDEGLIQLSYGFSKDGNHNLKQFIISMICCERLPVFISTASGNTSDKKYFRKLMLEYGRQIRGQFGDDKIFVFDGAFFTEANIAATGVELEWISRVPFTVNHAKQLRDDDKLKFSDCVHPQLKDYALTSLQTVDTTFGGIVQRWIVVRSKGKFERDKKSLFKKIDAVEEKMASSHSKLNKLQRKGFESKEQAQDAVTQFSQQLKYHKVTSVALRQKVKRLDGKRGRVGEGTAIKTMYSVNVTLTRDPIRIEGHLITAGRFIVATNVATDDLSDEEVLLAYKSQQNVERGFRFLKDPFFFAHSIFLEKPQRISALAMIMGIALMIYNLCELRLREALAENKVVFDDPTLGPNDKPTIRRVFQTFMGVHVIYTTWKGELVREDSLNIKPWHIQVLELLGERYFDKYRDGIYVEEKYIEAIKSKKSRPRRFT